MEADRPRPDDERSDGPAIPHESSTGLDPRLAAVLSYLLGFVSGVLFLVIERQNSFVRFHAMQSTITFAALLIARVVLMLVPLLGVVLGFLVTVIGVVLWLHLMYRAFQGQWYKLPYAGDLAEEQLGLEL